MDFRVLAVGDVVGNPGLEQIRRNLRQMKRQYHADFAVVNGENAAVVGITPNQADSILDAGADIITMGNHTWSKREIVPYMDDCPWIIRPANYAPQVPGRGWQVVQTAANVTEAQSVADTFDDMVTRLENGTFGGRIFGGTDDLRAEDCAFVTYTVRLQNKGFFPAEWISMELVEPKDGDVLALPDDSRHALAAGSVGDMQLTVLRRTDEEEQVDTARTLRVTCYVFGRKIVFDVSVA